MPRTPARCTEADMNRAAKVAKRHGMVVVITPDGTIRLELADGVGEVSKGAVKEREFTLG